MIDLDFAHTEPAAPPLDMLHHYFEAHGWPAERNSDDELVAEVEGSWTKYQLRALWRPDERMLHFVALLDVRVPEERRGSGYEVLSRINEQMWLGHFEMWSGDGTLALRHAVLLDDDGGMSGLSLSQAETLVDAAVEECERYYPVFQFVIWGGKTPTEALNAAMIDVAGEA
ncbi:MAG: YbjN domain-containing protein [Pacificimonas sp.]